ncbi:DNA mismatch repair protein MutS [hydrothermal vent metagenome]|uniref:DNA mismatch repair protein MutS n=1 Tax=hydrothermal vent metagenome TaxID=652676 RepID=A0A3B1D1P3_9ZZZZ
MSEQTPLMKQYFSIKQEHADAILFFRLGDFYEMFGEDARVASSVLSIALTTRDRGKEKPTPMCGVPHFAAESYITRLINAGYKVAVCEQVEDPKEAKGIVRREVVRVITPGTHTPENPKENNFILSFYPDGKVHGISVADLSTGEFFLYETDRPVEDEIQRFEPKEILCPSHLKGHFHYLDTLNSYFTTYYEDWFFDYSEAYRKMLEHFKVYSLEVFGCEEMRAAVSSSGALINYLSENQKGAVVLRKPAVLKQGEYMFLDSVTKRNIELIHNMRDGSSEGTLLKILDETLTPMGGRFLRNAILKPLVNIEAIRDRHEAVENLIEGYEVQETLRTYLRQVQDLERLSTRVLQRSANARDLIAIRTSVACLPEIRGALKKAHSPLLGKISGDVEDFSGLKDLIERAINDDPPNGLKDGGIIKSGYRQDVDEFRELSTKGKDYISGLEMKEKESTGISSLKIGYNRVFGYYLEVTKSNLHMVPEHYIRKQTLVGAERYVTPELKEYENRVLGAEERLKALEHEVFKEVLEEVALSIEDLLRTAQAIGELDFLLSLAVTARRNNYVKPLIDSTGRLEITDGRHPVLERGTSDEKFIPNSAYVDTEDHRLLIITGPNMAGKSTYMRQVALLVLMAQVGSFVPAAEARIGVVDRIFTRIGASDYLAKGQSTFMVEMIETANILYNATKESLIILDEVGRGTSTFDGISIAWAIAEHIANEIGARTLFATHYNELTELGITLSGVKNYNISVKEWGDEIIFLRKIERGPADKSYGIQVARLAGLPEPVVNRAKEVLNNLEKSEFTEFGTPRVMGRNTRKKASQLDLFSVNYEPIVNKLLGIDTSCLTPDEAVKSLLEIRKMAEDLR